MPSENAADLLYNNHAMLVDISISASHLQPRVIHLIRCCGVIAIPSRALVLPVLIKGQRGNLVSLLQELCAETQPNVPCDMAMHQPRTWIVSDESQHQVPSGRQHSHVAAWRVIVVERLRIVEDTRPGAKHVEVVAVQVDGVGEGWCDGGYGLDDPL